MSGFFAVSDGDAPWGDYGDILWRGLSRRDGPDAAVKLSRSGPYVPPLTQPFGELIVDGALRHELEVGSFTGFRLSEVLYEKVVRIDWHTWDARASEPAQYPESGEPEDYIVTGENDPRLLKEMPRLWSIDVPSTVGLQVQGSLTFFLNRHPGTDIAREGYVYWVNERLKSALEKSAGGWVSFKQIAPKL